MEDIVLVCANTKSSDGHCKNQGSIVCDACRLVHYCGSDCQAQHWEEHTKDCNSPMNSEMWQPKWLEQGRTPNFVYTDSGSITGLSHYLWDKAPAIDVLKLSANEGEAYGNDLQLLFAASGDMRSVVKTIASIPTSFKNTISITLNDAENEVVCRNAIMLLIALYVDNVDEAVDCLIHVWYSAFLKKSHMDLLYSKILPIIVGARSEIITPLRDDDSLEDDDMQDGDLLEGALVAKTWMVGTRCVRLLLPDESWTQLYGLFYYLDDVNIQILKDAHTSMALESGFEDWRERRYVWLKPIHRVCLERYREDGLLLPFGYPRDGFTYPNPTITYLGVVYRPPVEFPDPRDEWDAGDVLASTKQVADSDIYGRLYYYLQDMFRKFLQNSSKINVNFGLFNLEADDLPNYLHDGTFSRIDVGRICDDNNLGLETTLSHLGPLLETKHTNPYATLIMHFTKLMRSHSTKEEVVKDIVFCWMALQKYISPLPAPLQVSSHSRESLKFREYLSLFCPDGCFYRYMKSHHFEENGERLGMKMKEQNTIIEEWPFRISKQVTEEGAREEFEMRLGTSQAGDERYVEWGRI